MKTDTRRWRQFSLRTLLISAAILGPLSGWYGPSVVRQLRDLLTDQPPKPAVATATATKPVASNSQTLLEKQRLIRIENHKVKRENYKLMRERQALIQEMKSEPPASTRHPLVNRDGTFNMRYHHPSSGEAPQ